MKLFFYIIGIVVFYNAFIINLNSYRYRMKLAAYDSKEWTMIINYVCGICILFTIIPNVFIFTSMLIKNGLHPIDIDKFSHISGVVFRFFDIDRFKTTSNIIYHPFTYSMFICTFDFIFTLKGVYNSITLRNLRTQYFWYWGFTVISYYLIYKTW